MYLMNAYELMKLLAMIVLYDMLWWVGKQYILILYVALLTNCCAGLENTQWWAGLLWCTPTLMTLEKGDTSCPAPLAMLVPESPVARLKLSDYYTNISFSFLM